MQPGEDPREALTGPSNGKENCWKTKRRGMAEKERSEERGWESWEEARQVAVHRSEWRRIAEDLCAT